MPKQSSDWYAGLWSENDDGTEIEEGLDGCAAVFAEVGTEAI